MAECFAIVNEQEIKELLDNTTPKAHGIIVKYVKPTAKLNLKKQYCTS